MTEMTDLAICSGDVSIENRPGESIAVRQHRSWGDIVDSAPLFLFIIPGILALAGGFLCIYLIFMEIIQGNHIIAMSGLLCVFLTATAIGCLGVSWVQSVVFGFNAKLLFKNRVFKLRYGLLYLSFRLPEKSVIVIEPANMRGDCGCRAYIKFFNVAFLRLPLIPGYVMTSRKKKALAEIHDIYSCLKTITEETKIAVVLKE